MVEHTLKDHDSIRACFPALSQEINGRPLTYLDTAASALKPQCVIDEMSHLMQTSYSNIHRGLYQMSQETTLAFEQARGSVASFINAKSENEVVFTRNATESLNLVAHSWGRQFLKKGDIVLVSELEHHANIVPWHFLREETGIDLQFIRIDKQGNFDLEDYKSKLAQENVKLVSVAHISNALGTVLPIDEILKLAQDKGVTTLIDGCQGVVHGKTDVQALKCDFYVFSAHKLYGPSGIGILYGREDLLNQMTPYQGGGDMIETVDYDQITYKQAPGRFEAGTPAIVEAVGLKAAIDFMLEIGIEEIASYETALYHYLCDEIVKVDGVKLIGAAENRSSVCSFIVEHVHPHDLATLLDKQGVALRVGHHCAEPIMKKLGVPSGTMRASIGLYNNRQDVDNFIKALKKAISFF